MGVIKPAPTASFTVSPDTITNLNLTTQLYDQSSGYITSRIWDFGDNSPNRYDLNPIYTYSDSNSIYQISLIVEDENGCTESITAIIDLKLLILLSVKREENLLAKSILKRSVTKYEMITIEKKEKNFKGLSAALIEVETESQ